MLCRYRSPVNRASATLRKERHGTTCCVNARGDDHPDADVGHIREPDCGGPSSRGLVRRAVPAAGRGSAAGARAGHRATRGARRRARRDGRRPHDAVRALEGALRAHARARARAHRGSACAPRPAPSCGAIRSTRSPGCSPSSSRRHSAPRTRTATGTATAPETAQSPRSSSTRRPTTTTTPATSTDELEDGEFTGADPGAVRRYRFRHPTASGKTIAAAGFVEAARHLGVLILTHRRLLVSQFTRDLTTEGYGDRFTDAIVAGAKPRTDEPDHDPDVRLVRAPRLGARPRARTTSSSATRRTRRSARRRALRSAPSPSRSSSA